MNPRVLNLHVPQPKARPGDRPDFSDLVIPEPGDVGRPSALVGEAEIRDLPYSMIRVLDRGGHAAGPWNPKLSADTLHRALRAMVLTRQFDEYMLRAHRQGKTSFFMKSTGEEAIGAACSMAVDADDMCFPTYRMLSYLLARDYPLIDLANQIYSNAADPMKGRQLPIMYSARKHGFYSISGNLGTQFSQAVGWAMASAYKNDSRVALGFVGDGATAEGDFHAGMTFAAVYHAPAILCVTNNQWAISSFHGIAGGNETTFAARAIGYGLPGLRVDGNDFLAVFAAAAWAAERARSNRGATLIEFVTYRAAAHSTSDDPAKYRPVEEVAIWPLGDPIDRLKNHLIAIGEWSEDRHAELERKMKEDVRKASKDAEAIGTHGRSKPSVTAMFEDVYKDPDWRLIEQRQELGA